jgi:formylglycine-generating enzyme required for sulfatase activity
MGRGSGPDAFVDGLADEQPEHTATPLPFRLDVFEVTVGRFRRFLAGYPGNRPAAGAGAHAGIVNSGWQAAWNSSLPSDVYDFGIELTCSFRATWTDQAGPNENKPINCVTYYAAFAFCAWDGGFLPTEAEWELAAAGGAENRLYAWGSQAPDKTRTAVDCAYGANYPVCEFDDIPLVGMLTAGAARYGHLDMSGSMWEWALDAYSATYYSGAGQTCNNCANLSGTMRVRRGGSWSSYPEEIRVARRDEEDPVAREENSGVRCARP